MKSRQFWLVLATLALMGLAVGAAMVLGTVSAHAAGPQGSYFLFSTSGTGTCPDPTVGTSFICAANSGGITVSANGASPLTIGPGPAGPAGKDSTVPGPVGAQGLPGKDAVIPAKICGTLTAGNGGQFVFNTAPCL